MRRGMNAVRQTALIGMMAATVECAKLILASIPNVEAVTLLLAVYSYVFGISGVASALVFVCIEPLVWGFGTWFVSYLIYWPAVALVFFFLGKAKVKNRYLLCGVAVLLTFLFGILTSLVDIGLFSGSFDNFFYRLGIYYARGAVFYALHIGSNLVSFLFLFLPLVSFLTKIKARYFR